MTDVKLFDFQRKVLDDTANHNRVAYYLDMGLGKTFVGSEKMRMLNSKVNLLVCQKSKIDDWIEHFQKYYPTWQIFNLTKANELQTFLSDNKEITVGIINYDLIFRRSALCSLHNFTLMLDESSLIQNEKSKRSRFILNRLKPENVILLSGTPTGGKYEKLWSQIKLLGWDISRNAYWNQFVDYYVDTQQGFPLILINGYKNVDRLKRKLHIHGARFMKTEEVMNLPDKVFQTIRVPITKEYRTMRKDHIVKFGDVKLVGDTRLKRLLYMRMLCGCYNTDKLNVFRELLESTDDRLIVFYNFNDELYELERICKSQNRPISYINGHGKDLTAHRRCSDAVTLVQYGSGSMGENLQESCKIVYFTPPLSSEQFEQSKKRTHRIGQTETCFYYQLTCKGSVEEKIYNTLAMRKDYTDKLFERDFEDG